jgi:hypothetical protein
VFYSTTVSSSAAIPAAWRSIPFLFFSVQSGEKKNSAPALRMGSAEREIGCRRFVCTTTRCVRVQKFPKQKKTLARKCACSFPPPCFIARVVSRARHNLHRSRIAGAKAPPVRDPTSFSSAFFSFCFPYFGKRKKNRHAENSNGIRRDQKALFVTCRLGKVQKSLHGKRGPGRPTSHQVFRPAPPFPRTRLINS